MSTVARWSVLPLVLATAVYGLRPAAQGQEADRSVRETQGRSGEKEGGEQMMQCPMMAGLKDLKLFADGPAALLARADELGLEAEQKRRLEEIERASRRQAAEVLDESQRGKLKDAPDERVSMMQLGRTLGKNGKMKGEGMMCPMCMKMMRQRMQGEHGSHEGAENHEEHEEHEEQENGDRKQSEKNR